MSYVKESAASTARRRRRRRSAVVLTLCVLLLLGAFGYAVAYYQRWIGSEASASPQCTAAPASTTKDPLAPENIRVNVYNSTGRSGLAGDTARDLRDRDFDVDVVGNDPLHQDVRGPAVIRHGKAGAKQAKVLAKQLKGAKLVLDARTDSSVDLVLGQKFTKLGPAPKAAEPTKDEAAIPGC
jgi:hypothetical protein